MGKDLGDHGPIFDGGDDRQGPAALRDVCCILSHLIDRYWQSSSVEESRLDIGSY
ncbi:MAG: hypothetical protein ACREX9_09620 [Gammaproteobacteria bacterium]